MRSGAIVQHGDGTPTGSRSTSFFIRGILGPDAWSIFMRWLRGLAERFSFAASLVGRRRRNLALGAQTGSGQKGDVGKRTTNVDRDPEPVVRLRRHHSRPKLILLTS